jgi:tetratricopeptide (TPR) repeat protein
MEQGAYAQAQSYLEQALVADPDNRLALYLRGLCLQARGRFQEAIADFERLTSEPGPYAGEAGVQAADTHLRLNAPDRARRALDDASRAGVRSAAYYTVAGRLALASGDEEGALISFENAIRTDPNFASAYLERGLVHIKREATGQGLEDLDRFLALVGPGGRGSRINEVRALADQLRQAEEGPTPRPTEANV